uniref:NADH-ubiquinone oxidoreductase chain 5 n=1 Tax=Tropidothorax cruciger TaxID=1310363 RepID=A0A7T1TVI8_9HEMI|nr:NADH dehydrogenase subunit 5 [Tropidothorax cruciger]QPP20741.1 NADH dehydrogenase subunit 5 [Tropidothorax cruciger]
MFFNLYKLCSFYLFISGLVIYFLGLYFLSFDVSYMLDWEIFSINSCSVVMTLLFDWMSLLFIGSVFFISSMVILYSDSYMKEDLFNIRFLFLVFLFVISMMFMIISPNLVSILLGWDGLGLVSYCLVIYYQNFNSFNAGMLTILMNRLGDVSILLGIGVLFNSGSWYFMYYNYYCYDYSYFLMILVVLASFTKSAQIPFSSWLPAAMAAPTPVSALVHSSTLVTAGVYLLIRFSNLFNYFDTSFFLLISVLTMFMSSLGASFEYDIKKIIALSTLSQLGLMMSILFIGYPVVAFFHLLTHAFFKALLFLCAGLIIHCVNDTQDIRYMGGLVNLLPFTVSCFGISNFSLCGIPFLSGFYSKDMILELMMMSSYNFFIFVIFYVSVGLTVFYSIRLVYYVLFNNVNLLSGGFYSEDLVMSSSMIFLCLMSIFKGSILCWLIFPYPDLFVLPFLCKLLSLIFIFMGYILGLEFSKVYFHSIFYFYKFMFMNLFFGYMWFMPFFSTYLISSFGLNLSLNYLYVIEFGWGEFLISKLSCMMLIFFSKLNLFFQNNNIKIMMILFLMFIFLLVLI